MVIARPVCDIDGFAAPIQTRNGFGLHCFLQPVETRGQRADRREESLALCDRFACLQAPTRFSGILMLGAGRTTIRSFVLIVSGASD